MGRFFVRGIDASGRRRVERVVAGTGPEALARLAETGWRELELLTDAFGAGVTTPAAEATRAAVESTYDAEEELGFGRHGALWQLWMTVKKGGWVILLAVVYFGWRRATGVRWTGWDHFLLLAIAVCLVASIVTFWSSGRYRRMVLASAAGRWEEALRRVERLQRSRIGKLIPPHELGMRRANALLGLGREAEALAEVERLDTTGLAEWMVQTRLADFHTRRRRRAEALACLERAVELGGGQAEPHLSLAEHLAGFLERQPAAARAALERARAFPIARNLEWAVARIEAMIAVEEGRYEAALQHLAKSRRAFLATMADAGLHRGFLAYLAAYAAIALGNLSRTDEARAALCKTDAETWLAPHVPELLDRARAAAGSGNL